MNERAPTMLDVLRPRRYPANAKRAKVTRTIMQPEIDRFEQGQMEQKRPTLTAGAAPSAAAQG